MWLTTDDLADYIHQDLTDREGPAQYAVQSAVAVIESAAGQRFVSPSATTVKLSGGGVDSLTLPAFPVSSVDLVEVDGTELTENDYWLDERAGILYRDQSWSRGLGNITVTFTGGQSAPAEIELIAVRLAARIFENPQDYTSYSAEGISNVFGSPRVLTPDEWDVIRRYRTPLVR